MNGITTNLLPQNKTAGKGEFSVRMSSMTPCAMYCCCALRHNPRPPGESVWIVAAA